MDRQALIDFEKEVARRYEAGEVHAPCHLGGGNEDQLIKIFEDIKREDLVLCSWRSHLHAILHGIELVEVMRQILAGKSMSINSVDPFFYASSIVGGTLPIAVGLGLAIKRKGEKRHVWCFIGDMSCLTGAFAECTRYALNFDLPVTFVVEDNFRSVLTETRDSWHIDRPSWQAPIDLLPNVIYYQYELSYPHSGTGVFVNF